MKKRILFVGGTTGGGVATMNNEVVKIFRVAGYACRQVDTERLKARLPAALAYLLAYCLVTGEIIFRRPTAVYLQLSQTGYTHQSFPLLVAKLLRRRTIAHLHAKADLVGTCTPRQLQRIVASQRYIDQMIVLTASCRDSLIGAGWRGPIHAVPNFIDTTDFPVVVKPMGERRQFLYIGRMVPAKGIFEILEVAGRLPEESFVLVGNFDDEVVKQRFQDQLARTPNAQWLGPIYGDEKYGIIAESRFLLFPTRWPGEEFPMTLIEATLLGCIPLVSLVGSVGEIIKDGYNGVYIPADDVEAIVARIRELEERGDLQTISANGVEFARNRFTSDAVRDQLLAIIK
jgi:glycosyltransferase involved in cell wall biosynthesis